MIILIGIFGLVFGFIFAYSCEKSRVGLFQYRLRYSCADFA